MSKYAIPICLFAILFVGLPWFAAFRETQMVVHEYGRLGNFHVKCLATDKTHVDNYRCLIFDRGSESRVRDYNGVITLDGSELRFPDNKNVAVLSPSNRLRFLEVAPGQIQPTSSDSGILYIGGRVPKFKEFKFGAPIEDFVSAAVADW